MIQHKLERNRCNRTCRASFRELGKRFALTNEFYSQKDSVKSMMRILRLVTRVIFLAPLLRRAGAIFPLYLSRSRSRASPSLAFFVRFPSAFPSRFHRRGLHLRLAPAPSRFRWSTLSRLSVCFVFSRSHRALLFRLFPDDECGTCKLPETNLLIRRAEISRARLRPRLSDRYCEFRRPRINFSNTLDRTSTKEGESARTIRSFPSVGLSVSVLASLLQRLFRFVENY